ncbi:hypothetical protein YC2023_017119 [Brassica napus]
MTPLAWKFTSQYRHSSLIYVGVPRLAGHSPGPGQAAIHFTREGFTWARLNPVPLWCPEEKTNLIRLGLDLKSKHESFSSWIERNSTRSLVPYGKECIIVFSKAMIRQVYRNILAVQIIEAAPPLTTRCSIDHKPIGILCRDFNDTRILKLYGSHLHGSCITPDATRQRYVGPIFKKCEKSVKSVTRTRVIEI